MDRNLKPLMPPGPEVADRRLIDAQVLYELKNYESASIILFDVVEKYPNSAAYPESLFYLADSLYLMRDFLSSRRFFEKIIDQGPRNRRYQESLQALIELSLHTGDYSPRRRLHRQAGEAAAGQAAAVGAVRRGQVLLLPPAVRSRARRLEDDRQRPRLLFPLALLHRRRQRGAGSRSLAGRAAGVRHDPEDDAQDRRTEAHRRAGAHGAGPHLLRPRAVHQRARRVRQDRRQSDLFNDALYESAWVSIKGKDYDKAAARSICCCSMRPIRR